ncbi:endo-1,4-beta-xylanase [Pseudonocardia nigra]|uniref:endo-1,4-beta-xylanase n=1 Tax=Pseudonocardia nigra TaxID=1921578 RepID=UPI001C5DF035|nr:endo-1,4-beta-xylanase [Pseudonocardia nigra]
MLRPRRRGLRLAVPAIVLGAVLAAPGVAAAAPPHEADTSHRTDASLRQLADRHRLPIGTAADDAALTSDAAYREDITTEFSSVTAENVMKWESLEPERGQYDWAAADRLVETAEANGQQVRGHVLIWHSQLPDWLTENEASISTEEFREIVRNHIQTVVGRYKGRIAEWDVVNEAFSDTGGLRDSIFLRKLGPGYIADAFRWAHEADPKATLFYNDYSAEDVNRKSNEAYALIKDFVATGVPIDGFGMQAHHSANYAPTTMRENIQRFAALGLVTAVTEADVRMQLPVDGTKLQAQANVFSVLLSSCLAERSCISFTSWGFTDKYSWVPNTFEGQGAALFLDENLQAKPAYEAMRNDLLLTEPVRGKRGHGRG